MSRERWEEDAACAKHDPELWFPEQGHRVIKEATAICNQCPVQAECNAYAKQIKPSDGVWAGRNYTPRRRKAFYDD